VPAYSGGNRWVGVISGRSPTPPPTLNALAARRPRVAKATGTHQRGIDTPLTAAVVVISPNLLLSVHDLRQVIREIGRAYHFLDADYEAEVCRRLVKKLRHGQPPDDALPEWLRGVIARGFSA
jgi:hypothetical protein